MNGKGWLAGAAVLFLLLAAAVATRELRPPAPRGADTPPAEFSAARAMADVETLAAKPHPVGSGEHARVRERLVERFAELGLAPEVQETTAVLRLSRRHVRGATVYNVIGRRRGQRPGGKAVCLLAHYDSVPTGPGAADDASGVAVLLEVARALVAGAPLENDVVFLVTDAEEVGLLGAVAFLRDHPLAAEIGAVLNFEARGHRGPSVMFETSGAAGALIAAYADVAADPVASSLTQAVYERMPNGTDLTAFGRRGIPGLNFAFFNGVSHYHSALDTPERLDRGSLQHHGDAALALARQLGDEPLLTAPVADRVYFSVLRRFVVHYPAWLHAPLVGLAVLLLLAALVLGFRNEWITGKSLRVGLLVTPAALAAAALVAYAVGEIFAGSRRELVLYQGEAFMLAVLVLTLSVTTFVLSQLRGIAKIEGVWAGALAWWAAVAVGLTVVLGGGSYVFAGPLLFAAGGLLLLVKRPRTRRFGFAELVVVSLAVSPGLLLVVPLVWLLFQALTFASAVVVAAALVLLLGLLTPHLLLALAPRRFLVVLSSAAAGFLMLAYAILTGGIDADHPRWDSVAYCVDAARQEAIFAVFGGEEVDEWTAQFLALGAERGSIEAFLPGYHRETLFAKAPALQLPGVVPDPVELEIGAERRTCTVRLPCLPGVRRLTLTIAEEIPVELLEVNGTAVVDPAAVDSPPAGPGPGLALTYFAPPADGVVLKLAAKAAEPVEVSVVAAFDGLPALAGVKWLARPDWIIPVPNVPDTVYVRETFRF